VPVWNAIAPASEAVASGDVRRFVVHYEQDMLLHLPLEMTLADADQIPVMRDLLGCASAVETPSGWRARRRRES
jgi:hypothetical protein